MPVCNELSIVTSRGYLIMIPLIKESTVFNHCAHELAADIYADPNVCSSKPHIHFFKWTF